DRGERSRLEPQGLAAEDVSPGLLVPGGVGTDRGRLGGRQQLHGLHLGGELALEREHVVPFRIRASAGHRRLELRAPGAACVVEPRLEATLVLGSACLLLPATTRERERPYRARVARRVRQSEHRSPRVADDRRRVGRDGAEVGDVAVHGELDLAAATLERLPHLELGGERRRQPGHRARCARASVQHHHGTVPTGVRAHFDGLHQWQSPRSTGPTLATVEAEPRYTKSGDAYIAYQVLGDGGPDLLYLSSGTISIGSIDDEPGFARFHGDLASFARLIRMDLRGVGLSDPIDPSTP